MNTIRNNFCGAFLVSMLSASAVADTMIVLDHNAKAGPQHDALVQCVRAARNNPEFGPGLMFSTRMGASESASGSRTFILSGSAWEDGSRIPVTARCVTSPSGRTIASVTRIYGDTRVAKAAD